MSDRALAKSGAAARHAIYAVPRPDHLLAALGRTVLGRDVETGDVMADGPRLVGQEAPRWFELTRSARHYGFHATLKAPIRLATGRSLSEFAVAVDTLAARLTPVSVRLRAAEIGGFGALIPFGADDAERVEALGAEAVQALDEFRQPASDDELARRRGANLTVRQDEFLVRWGYPYVLDEFRFHMTLSDRLRDPAERTSVLAALADAARDAVAEPWLIEDLVVVTQLADDEPFVVTSRHRLQG